MTNKEKGKKPLPFTLFPVQQRQGSIVYYVSDFSEELGDSVYRGYQCTLVNANPIHLKPRHVKKEELKIDHNSPVAIKLYDGKHHPSPFQFYASEIAVLDIKGRDVLIMDYIDGFHIYPDARDNPELNQLTFLQVVEISWQLILQLNTLHYRNTSGPAIVHGDIKGENIKIKIKEIETPEGKKYKVDVSFLDLDYAKLITDMPQIPQGTPEHVAIEILNGNYSESSDFFALSPLLLSLFGAHNPLKKIIEFRNNNMHMKRDELIRTFRDIGFCTEGLFEHFKEKPDLFVCELVKKFILNMGKKNREDRPSPNAILEFFTALRQLSLLEESNNFDIEKKSYFLRLSIAAQEEHWLTEKKYQTLFFHLDEHLQNRLITLMSMNQCVLFYKIAQESNAPAPLINQLRRAVADHLAEQICFLKKPSWTTSFFSSPPTSKDIQWLLYCYEHNDSADFYSTSHEKTRKKLEQCSKKSLAPLISIITEGLTQKIDSPLSSNLSN
ncbi:MULTISPECIES: protein kinase domain-containing protein [Legionella]|uniref:Protein kinase domain-containing protein n=1 Tax=Legionella resiliens TaxID=2905958 RepID=A0ABS8X2V1_9GAMM|nr:MULTISPECIES: hypothetical protein [unclassified Legionella]MCE0722936.1 hypothetical protein [Legionella sp. 9fVS26]MCE3532089.1 hypothetical protein [Legionella sp. 8cVS16]QLZ68215.1 hypothetical protein FOLKNPGA_00993 [Legionella sp. PC1000]